MINDFFLFVLALTHDVNHNVAEVVRTPAVRGRFRSNQYPYQFPIVRPATSHRVIRPPASAPSTTTNGHVPFPRLTSQPFDQIYDASRRPPQNPANPRWHLSQPPGPVLHPYTPVEPPRPRSPPRAGVVDVDMGPSRNEEGGEDNPIDISD
jgi:hypothetical protein